MPSLKRSWTGTTDAERAQKKPCADPDYEASQIDILDDTRAMKIESHGAAAMARFAKSKLCGHETALLCTRTQRYCCACADKRPKSSASLRYADTRNDSFAASRWQYYCPSCKGMLRISAPGFRIPLTIQQSTGKAHQVCRDWLNRLVTSAHRISTGRLMRPTLKVWLTQLRLAVPTRHSDVFVQIARHWNC